MPEPSPRDRGFNDIADRAVLSLILFLIGFGMLIVSVAVAPEYLWLSVIAIGVCVFVRFLWVRRKEKRWHAMLGRPQPICCPKCRYLTGTPSGACPRCGETIPSHACIGCGYDLRGNASGVCPECGFVWDPPYGTVPCFWDDCNHPNPKSALTCQRCDREISYCEPYTEQERKEIELATWFGIWAFLPWWITLPLLAVGVAVVLIIVFMFVAGAITSILN